MDSPRLLQAEIHNNYSSISGTWDAYKSQIAGLYSATGYAASGNATFQDFSNHLMREYNSKIIKLNMGTGMLISPYDAGYRFTGIAFENFSPLSLFSAGEQGLWYDPTDLTTMFESVDGSTAVHTPGNGTADSPVGLLLNKSVMPLTYSAHRYWRYLVGNSINTAHPRVSRIILSTSTTSTDIVVFTGDNCSDVGTIPAVGATYSYDFGSAVTITSASIYGTWSGGTRSARVTIQWSDDNTNWNSLFDGVAFSTTCGLFTVTNLGSRYTAFQTTSTARPVLSARYNLLTYTEQFNAGATIWNTNQTTVTANTTTAPDGTVTADSLMETAVTNRHVVYYNNGSYLDCSQVSTHSIYIKDNGRRYFYFYVTPDDINFIYLIADLTTGTITDSGAGGNGSLSSTSITALSNSWYRVTMTGKPRTSSGVTYYILAGSNVSTRAAATITSGCPSYLGDVTKGFYIWGADSRVANDGIGLPVYQKVVDANTYDSVGFPYYIKFDGVDDCLSTSAINLTTTNKLSLFGSFRRLANGGIPIEFGTVTPLTGNFALFAGNAISAANDYWTFASGGTTTKSVQSPSGYTAQLSNVVSGLADIGAPSINLRINGASVGTDTTSQGTGNYSSYSLFFGRRNNASLPFNGRAYGLIIRGASSSSTDINNAETWLNTKVKVY